MPSPVEDRPGLLIRDSLHYSDAVLIIPPPLVPCLACFDGGQTPLDLRAALVEATGELEVGQLEEQLIDVLARSGFLHDEIFAGMKQQRAAGVRGRAGADAFARRLRVSGRNGRIAREDG